MKCGFCLICAEIRIKSLSISLLGGVVFVQQLQYTSKNMSVRLLEGAVLARLWATMFRKSASQADLPCRLEAQLKGLEVVLMNNRFDVCRCACILLLQGRCVVTTATHTTFSLNCTRLRRLLKTRKLRMMTLYHQVCYVLCTHRIGCLCCGRTLVWLDSHGFTGTWRPNLTTALSHRFAHIISKCNF